MCEAGVKTVGNCSTYDPYKGCPAHSSNHCLSGRITGMVWSGVYLFVVVVLREHGYPDFLGNYPNIKILETNF